MDLKPGDSFVTEDNLEYLVVSAEGFNLKDFGFEANFISISVKYGMMMSYHKNIEDIFSDYKVKEVIPNENSFERRNKLL